ncbi:MAG: lactate dehydrogenase [Actinomycetota bacterium]|nr:lactate dehydrogenase [Actinomycetota bacterium]
MDVAILGATGDVGRQLATQLIEQQVLPTTSRLQLVGREGGRSADAAWGMRADLIDAYDEVAPALDVALRPEEVVADVIVVCAGGTVAAKPGQPVDRAALAAQNLAVFDGYAAAIERWGSGHEVVVVVSNPVELGVATFAERLDRHRVIGMGAWLDTLRFRREIASSLGIRRQRVSGFVVGEHGEAMVPLWSTVRIHGLDPGERADHVERLRAGGTAADYDERRRAEQGAVMELLTSGRVADAFRQVDRLPPDLRASLRPFATHLSGAKTAAGTANATVDLLDTILDGRDIVVAGQVLLDGELAGCDTVMGVPVVIGPSGWTRVIDPEMDDDELACFDAAAATVAGRIASARADHRAAA